MIRTRGLGAAAVLGSLLVGCDSDATDVVNDDPDPPPPDPGATHDYRVNELVEGLDHPWGMAFLPDGDVLVTERSGQVRLVSGWELRDDPVEEVPQAVASGQGGMLDIALHPDFEANGYVYLTYSKEVDDGLTTAVARARWENGALHDLEDVFVADAAGGNAHFGSRVAFDGQGLMYVTVGDRGRREAAQDVSNHVGTTVRLHDDGSVPPDNPFTGDPDARDEIFTYGNRNAQGMAIHPETGQVWQNEHGPQGGDELNRMEAGGNYGWPEYNFGDHYNSDPIPDPDEESGTVLPLTHWTPAIAPSGLAFYTGELFPDWRDSAFNGGLAGRQIRRVVLDGDEVLGEEVLLEDYGERVRDVVDGPDGYLYFLTDRSDGVLARLEPDD